MLGKLSGASGYKQAIILRTDLGMGKGKLVAQGSHASVDAFLKAPPAVRAAWQESGCEKICLKAGSEKELATLFQKAKNAGLPASIIADAGHTQVEAGSKTAVAIGPAKESEIDAITGELKLL